MTTKIFTIISALSTFFFVSTSCSATKIKSEELTQGSLVFDLTGEYVKGQTFDFQFNEENLRINKKSDFGSEQNYIFDKTSNEILSLVKHVNPSSRVISDQYFLYLRPEELIHQGASYGDTIKTVTDETKIILGYECRKVILELGKQVTVEYWFTDKIKPGIVIKETPLIEEGVALMYELKIFNITQLKYEIKSIVEEVQNPKIFEHVVPDGYALVIPFSQFSLDSMWASSNEPNTFTSFEYPNFNGGRDSLKSYLNKHLMPIMPYDVYEDLTVSFVVEKNGELSNVIVNYGYEFEYKGQVEKIIKEMPMWIPAKVKGIPVLSDVTVFF